MALASVPYPSGYSDMLFDEERIKEAMTKSVFGGDAKLFEQHAHWVLSDTVMEDFLDDYLGEDEELPRGGRKYELIVYGASGYTGELTFEYICKWVKTPLKLCLAGRTAEKVKAMKDKVLAKFPGCIHDPDVMRADLKNPLDLRKIALSCDCVINIAGPFMLTGGEMLVEACLQHDCDYVDVNGEVPYTHKLLQYHTIAKAAKVFIVPNSAFAGGATDLACWLACRTLKEKHGEKTRQCRGYIAGSDGAVPSGGTLATREAMNAALKDVASIMANPFSLGGTMLGGKRPEDQDKPLQAQHPPEDKIDGYCGPFMYSFFETRVVRRSNMLMEELGGVGEAFGPEFNFQEWALFKGKEEAERHAKASTSSKNQEEELKKQGKLYKTGEGLGEEDRKAAWSKYQFFARSPGGKKVKVTLDAGDAYEETGHMAVEVALCLVKDREKLLFEGGVLTPATAGGHVLVDRLNSTGMTLTADDE